MGIFKQGYLRSYELPHYYDRFPQRRNLRKLTAETEWLRNPWRDTSPSRLFSVAWWSGTPFFFLSLHFLRGPLLSNCLPRWQMNTSPGWLLRKKNPTTCKTKRQIFLPWEHFLLRTEPSVVTVTTCKASHHSEPDIRHLWWYSGGHCNKMESSHLPIFIFALPRRLFPQRDDSIV